MEISHQSWIDLQVILSSWKRKWDFNSFIFYFFPCVLSTLVGTLKIQQKCGPLIGSLAIVAQYKLRLIYIFTTIKFYSDYDKILRKAKDQIDLYRLGKVYKKNSS